MFLNTQMGGQNTAFPDVCNTPTLVGTIPTPYSNVDMGMTADPTGGVLNVLIGGMPAHTMRTKGLVSNGDNSGVSGGVVSGQIMGPRQHLLGCLTLLIGGMPATKMSDITAQNGTNSNAVGATLIPAQYAVLCLK
ncbi:MAG: DUF4150 domain-containing protein [Deltaproteobacteria bacterium]|nr:DUF4150 domain-containing protein [Deltaproteobacteria bacterium]